MVAVFAVAAVTLSGCVLIPPSPAEVSIRKTVDGLDKAEIGKVLCQHEQRDFTPLSTVPYQNSVGIEDVDNSKEVIDYLVAQGFSIRDDLAGSNYQTLSGPGGIRATVFSLTRDTRKSVSFGDGNSCEVPKSGLVAVNILPQ